MDNLNGGKPNIQWDSPLRKSRFMSILHVYLAQEMHQICTSLQWQLLVMWIKLYLKGTTSNKSSGRIMCVDTRNVCRVSLFTRQSFAFYTIH